MQKFTLWFGVVMLLVGVLGFVPGVTTDGHLLGIFDVDGVHNVIHLLTGIIAIVVAKKSMGASKTFLKVFGVIYGLVTIVGFVQGDTVLGLIGVNMADNVLHLVIAALALWLGFKKEGMTAPSAPIAPQM